MQMLRIILVRPRRAFHKERQLPMNMARMTVRLALPVLMLGISAASARAQEPPAQQQREHLVRPGDTLWDLARTYFSNPFLWRLIAEANPGVVEDPHWIYPTERLIIPAQLQTPARGPVGVPVPIADPVTVVETVAEPEDTPAVAVSLDLRRPIVPEREYLAVPWLSLAAEQVATGSIVRMTDPGTTTDQLESTLFPQDRVVVEGAMGGPGDSLLVVRIGRRVGENWYVVQPVGVLEVEAAGAAHRTARLVNQFGDARVGDAVMPLPAVPPIGLGEPEAVQAGVEGQLLQFLVDEDLHGTTDLAFISVGRAAGVGIGDEFGVYIPAPEAGLPAERVATVRVVRADERTSTVRVLTASSTALRNGLPVRLIRRMPVN